MSMEGRAENCSSVIAPALPYYRPSMDICIFRTSHIHVGRMSQRARDGGAVIKTRYYEAFRFCSVSWLAR